jgi:hypothetical protein
VRLAIGDHAEAVEVRITEITAASEALAEIMDDQRIGEAGLHPRFSRSTAILEISLKNVLSGNTQIQGFGFLRSVSISRTARSMATSHATASGCGLISPRLSRRDRRWSCAFSAAA